MTQKKWIYTSRRPEATRKLGEKLAQMAPVGTVFALVGDLGMGKTHFVQGFARGMGVHAMHEVASPTYTLANMYPAKRCMMVHMDFYRLHDSESARDLGLEEQLLREDAVAVVEWANQLPTLIPDSAVTLEFEWLSASERSIQVTGMDCPKGLRLVEHL
ncbi:MAG: tRNA (adenosine(37)-N6)-threonylcarbamoyltransferase complex ATPase subunit type 1 TsaE [Deltaproteobacteria bacterium]|jgi:tRNA threonylcarbamoyladenosine biosynthesis protein TsaE|nr:tRNA (adenosine(37)-N6)-threonylcarbamoyltransferase complex ATPase subunit type 1 TsaE [Deltaproteobacteria bacterium]MBT6435446.1 tRNA (adenosine(37)-N6)-threonylcarbamoyltransferase complex ATPase subunit type 1 TsaE [Deltaproteobacteria bacterium]MBT6491918.1 tRNA (adenosine(37)-N6)-threonylcarbamoyltransferase complex ATPase subunit type 1 TsaE [Deltaproteobacteria bacterium]